MAYPRGEIKIKFNPRATSVDNFVWTIATPSFFAALTEAETAALLALAGNEARLSHVYENAGSLWTGSDFCEIDDPWDPIHRVVNRHPPVEPFEWDIGEPPLKYILANEQSLLVECPDNELNLLGAKWAGPMAKALEPFDRVEFLARYRAHSPPDWENAHLPDADFCWENFLKLREFYSHHAGTGKNLVFAVEY